MSRLSIVKAGLERGVNGYVLRCSETGEAAVIDAGLPAQKLMGQLGGARLRWIISTHGHLGHVEGKEILRDATGADTAMSVFDAKAFLRSATRYVADGDELELGRFALRVLHTPGHTPGSICILVGNHLFTGDTLLANGVGKPGPEADPRRQMVSIFTKLMRLPPTTAVYPGHGPVTSLEAEARTNPYLRGASR